MLFYNASQFHRLLKLCGESRHAPFELQRVFSLSLYLSFSQFCWLNWASNINICLISKSLFIFLRSLKWFDSFCDGGEHYWWGHNYYDDDRFETLRSKNFDNSFLRCQSFHLPSQIIKLLMRILFHLFPFPLIVIFTQLSK